jgi:hypothetical protein
MKGDSRNFNKNKRNSEKVAAPLAFFTGGLTPCRSPVAIKVNVLRSRVSSNGRRF